MADCNALWLTFAGMYGAKSLEAKFGATPPDEWRRDIARLKDYEVDRGLARMKARGEAHIPSLPMFIRLCREVINDADSGGNHDQAKPEDKREFARWVVSANRHLLAYLMTRTKERNAMTADESRMDILVTAKNNWAEQMREWERDGELPADHGHSLWVEMMRGSEQSIDMVR